MNKAILVGWITDIREVGSYGVMVKLKKLAKRVLLPKKAIR